jgi:hypothetical protein
VSKFDAYSIDFEEMLVFLGIGERYLEIFNEIICSACFERIIEFERYRKRCQNAHKRLIEEIQDFDRKAGVTRFEDTFHCNQVNVKVESKNFDPLFAYANATEIEDNRNDSACDERAYSESDESAAECQDTLFAMPLMIKTEIEEESVLEADIKKEPEAIFTTFFSEEEESLLDEIPEIKRKRKKVSNTKTTESKRAKKDRDTTVRVKTEAIPEPRPRKKFFECFFCRNKFLGCIAFNAHECDKKKVKCEVDGCETVFTSQSGYNQHTYHRHGLPKISKRFCPACKTSFQMNAIQFDRHCRQCTKENDFDDKPIKCKLCEKICDNIRIYAAHRMIHETRDLKKATMNEKGIMSVARKSEICDLCGKTFDAQGLRKHRQNVHLVDFNGQMFHCDICPIAKPTKRLLQNHIRRTHVVKWHSCETCGKMLKNRDTWKKHQLVHGNTKSENICELCPRSPGFVTKTELRKHMANCHGGEQPIRKFTCNVCGAAYSRDDQLIRHRASVHQLVDNTYTEEIINEYRNKN